MRKINSSCCFATAIFALLLIFSYSANAQGLRTVTGRVTDANSGESLIGVTVHIKGAQIGTDTDIDGKYSLKVSDSDVMIFSLVGYDEIEVAANGRATIDVALKTSVTFLNEVVVIGYGKTTKKEVTGSVSSLKSDELSTGSFTNAAGLLQGKVAGLSVTNADGADPNASFDILLRGTNTLKAGQGPLIIIDGVVGADMRNINYQEIESVDVLKDGSAAAIYGTRGTNGVIIITTRRAREGRTSIEYDGHVSVQTVTRRAVPMTASEFKDIMTNYMPSAASSLYGSDTDWFKEITRTPVSQKHSLAISGGNKDFSHRTVFDVELNQGIQKKNDSNKYLFKTNITQNAFNGWLKMDYNAYISKRDYTPANYSAFEQAFYHNPTEPVYDSSNEVSGGYFRVPEMAYYNPVAMIDERTSQNTADDAGINARLTLNILPIKGLNWDNFISYTQQRYESRQYSSRYYPSLIGEDGNAYISNEFSKDIQWESTVNYSKTFGKHSIQALAGYAYEKGVSQSSSMTNYGFDSDDWLTNNIGAGSALTSGLASMSSYKESNTYIAFFGRLMYNYAEKYLASVSLRRDGSSRFGTNHKWGWFPAVSLGWRIKGESFMDNVNWVDDLKLRAGFGMTGNQDFGDYKSLLLMKTSGYFYYNGQWINTYAPASNANPDLGWEKKAEWNAGLDFSLFRNRLSGTIDYYYRLTYDLLYTYTVPTPPYVYDEMFTNVGEVSNTGIEVMLNGKIFDTKNFKWNATATFSKNMNKLVKFTNSEFTDSEYRVGWLNSPIAAYPQRLIEGESLGTFYGPVWTGTDSAGNDTFKNQTSDGTVPELSWEKLGCAYPDFVIGLSNYLTYGNFDFNMSLRLSLGGKVYNQYATVYRNLTSFGLKNVLADWNSNKYFGGVYYSSKYLEDATYLKLDDVSVGYNFKLDSDIVKGLRLYLAAQNILCLTGYTGIDPEVSLSGIVPGIEGTSYYPRTAVFTLGASLKF